WLITEPEFPLYINEFMAVNGGSLLAPDGNASDWLEIFNAGSDPIYLGDKFLSDNPIYPSRWRMPDEILGAGEFKLFWADDDENQGSDHTNFRLAGDGGFIGIYSTEASNLRPINTLTYEIQSEDVSMGLIPDGEGEIIVLGQLTPGYSNLNTGITSLETTFSVYPNPATDFLILQGSFPKDANWVLYTIDGKLFPLSLDQNKLDLPELVSGFYFLKVENRNSQMTIPVSIQ
ncbi:MAG: hypothetical protein ACI959_001907, partial [Limisphaerales bacterium]